MTGYIQLYSGAEVNEQELSDFATDFVSQHGVVRQDGVLGLLAEELSPLDGRKINITTGGKAYVPNDSYAANGTNPKYWLTRFSGAIEELSFAANSSGSTRIDLICVKVDTTVPSADPDNTGVASLVVVQGNPGAGVPATPADHLALWQVTCANGFTQLTNANLTDVRTVVAFELSNIIPGEGTLIGGRIAVSAAGNNLTVAIKTLDNNDPTPASPVYIILDKVLRRIDSALSIVMNGGTTNRFNAGSLELRAKTIDYFLYGLWDATAGVVRLVASRIPYASTYNDFNSTSTHEKFGQVSGGTPSTSSVVAVIGRYDAILSFSSPNYNWTVPGSPLIIQKPTNTTRGLDWSPQFVGFSVAPVVSTARYQIIGDKVEFYISMGNGISNATNFQITLPMSSISFTSVTPIYQATDNSGNLQNTVAVVLGSTVDRMIILNNSSGTGWTAANNKRINSSPLLSYPII